MEPWDPRAPTLRRLAAPAVALALAALVTGCFRMGLNQRPEGDAELDADADIDADTGADADVDADVDADSDTDADSDADADADADVDADVDGDLDGEVPTGEVTAVAAGGAHTCVLLATGAVLCFGENGTGQLGDGTNHDRPAPTPVEGVDDAVEVACGASHTCVRRAGGQVLCFGLNIYGQLGDGTIELRYTPTAVVWPVAELPLGISAGESHSCAVIDGGGVECWGLNDTGQLGDGSLETRLVPVATALAGAAVVRAGGGHTCALLASGEARCWGDNWTGQLGDGSTDGSPLPVAVGSIAGATSLAAGSMHACAADPSGEVSCWGNNASGQVGDGTNNYIRSSPVRARGVTGVSAVAAGGSMTCALRAAGTVSCWGGAESLGDGALGGSRTPVEVSGLGDAVAIAVGDGHACALRAGGTVACWGGNSSGQLGDGTTEVRTVPTPVAGLP